MRRRERGAVLLLVLAAVAMLTILAVELAARASGDSLRATRSARDAGFRRLVDSGCEVAKGMLAERPSESFDSWNQTWNQPISFALSADERAVVRVSDESGKLNIARAVSNPEEADTIRGRLERLFDYLSRHDTTAARAWEAMQAKVFKRLARRQPLWTLDGLREAGLGSEELYGVNGLSRYLTCFGDGTINLNTAPRAVLFALDPEFDEAMVGRIAGYRGKGEGEPGTYKPFQDPKDLILVEGIVNRSVGDDGKLRVDRNLYEKVRSAVGVKGNVFSARIESFIGDRRRESWSFYGSRGARIALEELVP